MKSLKSQETFDSRNSHRNSVQLRSNSARASPVFPDKQPETSQRYMKARVPEYLSQSKWLEERPRGIAKAQFSDNGRGSFSISESFLLPHKPSRKMFPDYKPHEPPQKEFSKKVRPQTPQRNPILQDDQPYEQKQPTMKKKGIPIPSPLTVYENNKKYCLPCETGRSNH